MRTRGRSRRFTPRCWTPTTGWSSTTCSPGARAYYDRVRARGTSHHAALRQLSNRLVGILHGCLASRTVYDEDKAWPTIQPDTQAA
jgi:hypothetical protein